MKKTNLILVAALVCLTFIVVSIINVSAEPPPGKGKNKKLYPMDIPQTGQTDLYAVGDDGDLQMGVAWPDPRFTDNEDGTVTDNLTGLLWLKDANCFGGRSWANALSDANGLADGGCGLSDGSLAGDWRLPNVKELQSLIHYGVHDPALPDTSGMGQWSEGDPFTGVLCAVTGCAYGYFVWPVRGGN